MRYEGRAIILIRNPINNIVSHWNHGEFGIHYKQPLIWLPKDLKTKRFEAFYHQEIKLWYEAFADFLIFGKDLIVVYYEELTKDTDKVLNDIKTFLKLPKNKHGKVCEEHLLKDTSAYRKKKMKVTRDYLRPSIIKVTDYYLTKLKKLIKLRGFSTKLVDSYFK